MATESAIQTAGDMGLRDINAIRLVAIESGELLAEETVAVRVAAMPPRELLNSPP